MRGTVRRVRRLGPERAGVERAGAAEGREARRERAAGGAEVSGVVVSIMDVWRWVVATITGGQGRSCRDRETTAPDDGTGNAGFAGWRSRGYPSGWGAGARFAQ